MLAISDTGVGMNDEVKAHLFEPFFTTKERDKGTGLGLATVFGIVKQNRGHIGVYSEAGQGTTFRIYLPRAQETMTQAPIEKLVHNGRGSETILLAEDETAVRDLTVDILRAQGYHVLVARDGPEALRLHRAYVGPVHLLLTDVVMPHMNGRELADRVRAERPGIRVLLMSGYAADIIDQHSALEAGMAFLAKPLTIENLMRSVRALLDDPG